MAIGVAQRLDRGQQRICGSLDASCEARDGRYNRQIEPMPFGIERIRRDILALEPGVFEGRLGAAANSRSPRLIRYGGGRLGRAIGRMWLGCREKPLQITQAVAPIAARVYPEVAQPTGVAPGSDRVRVNPQEPGGLGDR